MRRASPQELNCGGEFTNNRLDFLAKIFVACQWIDFFDPLVLNYPITNFLMSEARLVWINRQFVWRNRIVTAESNRSQPLNGSFFE